jgi:hypothetical protein
MAYYKYIDLLRYEIGPEYDALHSPGAPVPYSGIYRCHVCGHEVTSNMGQPLPPQNHHVHTSLAHIRWQLIVKTAT